MSEDHSVQDGLGPDHLIVNRVTDLGRPADPQHGLRVYERDTGQILQWDVLQDGWVVVREPGHRVQITSFGFLHDEPPAAHLLIDLRVHFRDPHIRPELRYMTAADLDVRRTVLATPGVLGLINAIEHAVMAMLDGPAQASVTVAFGCQGGRHRAPVAAMELARVLGKRGITVGLEHRDLAKDVVNR